MGLIVDTSALIAIERGAVLFEDVLVTHGRQPTAMPAIVWAELLAGVRLAASPVLAARRRGRLERLRLLMPIIDFDANIAERYADIFAACSQAGTPIPANDMAVAATALYLNYDVLVGQRDEKHFRVVPDLKVITVSRAT